MVFTTTKFLHLTEMAAKAFALPDARIAVVGHPIGDTPLDTLQTWADEALEGVVASYCGGRQSGSRKGAA